MQANIARRDVTTEAVRTALHEIAEGPHIEHITSMVNNRRADLVDVLHEMIADAAKQRRGARTKVFVKGVELDVQVDGFTPGVAPVIFAPVERCHPGEDAEVEYSAIYWNGIEVSELVEHWDMDGLLEEQLLEAEEEAREKESAHDRFEREAA